MVPPDVCCASIQTAQVIQTVAHLSCFLLHTRTHIPPLHSSVQYSKSCSHLLTRFEHPLVMPAEFMFTQMDEIHYVSSKINSPNYRSESVHLPFIEILVHPSTFYLSVMWQMHSIYIYIVIVALIFFYMMFGGLKVLVPNVLLHP